MGHQNLHSFYHISLRLIMYWINNFLNWVGYGPEPEQEEGPNPLLLEDSYSNAFRENKIIQNENNSNICNDGEIESDEIMQDISNDRENEQSETMPDIANCRLASTSIKSPNKTNDESERTEESVDCFRFTKGDIVYRKGIACKIIDIHHDMIPPTVTVKNIIDQREINTEFAYLMSEKAYIRSQKDMITKKIFNKPAIEEKQHKIVVTKEPNHTDQDQKDIKKKKKVKKPAKSPRKKPPKSPRKKGVIIAQIQNPPTKSKRKRKIVKAKRMKDKKITKKATKTSKKKTVIKSKKIPTGSRKRRFSAIDDTENIPRDAPSTKRRKISKNKNENKCITKIYGERTRNGNIEYLMKFKGCTTNQSIWQKSDNSESVKAAIEQFQSDQKNDKKKKYMQRVVKQIYNQNQQKNKDKTSIDRIMEIIGCGLKEAEYAYFECSNENEEVAINYLLENPKRWN